VGSIRYLGAGCGATTGKWGGAEPAPGGLATELVGHDDLRVAALVAVNAFGFVGETEAAVRPEPMPPFGNTTIGVVATNARLGKLDCYRLAQGAHDGLARAVTPPHTLFDGDAFVAAATGGVDAHVEQVRALTVLAVERAIRSVD
jgi:L-aminopeptidase/D-esterase-like protein